MRNQSCLRCFSLVELLSVTCIAVAIIALLFPALERAKGMARKTFCKGNLQQMVVTTNLYKADNRGVLPYSSTWLVDFSFLENYITNFDVAVCPDTDDSVTSKDDLNGQTSYHYMGSRYDWEKNYTDGTGYGFDPSNTAVAALLSSREEKVIYDRSDMFHYGMFNVVHLDSGHIESLAAGNYGNYWFYDDVGSLDTLGTLDTTGDRANNRNRYRHRYRHGNTETNGNGNGYGSTDGDAGSEYSDNGSSDTSTTTTASTDTSSTDTTTTEDGKNNNGHGNNEDGVDCSNPGQGNGGPNGTEDASGTVDDESKGGGNNKNK